MAGRAVSAKGSSSAGHGTFVEATAREEQFRRLFQAEYRQVLAYALRRTGDLAEAQDAVAEVFTVAWRRIADAPAEEAARPWLFAIARRTIANQQRAQPRRLALRERLRLQPASAPPEPRTHWTDGRGFIPSSMRGVLSCLAPNQSSSSDAGALRDLGDSVPREAVAVARADRKAGAEWIESVQDRSQTITGTSGTTGPPRLTSHLVRKGGKGMDERARGLDDEQATLAVVVGVDTRLRQCPSDLPCLVGRYDLTWVAAGQP